MKDSEKLYDKLIEYSRSRAYPFHMPGHKRRLMTMEDPYRFDLTEIDGFDNLHEAEGLLKREQERAARLYGAEESHFLVNGSTGGILAAVSAAARRGDRILAARNCHKSVYHAIELNGLRPVYLWPEMDEGAGIYGGISREAAERMLEAYPDIRAIVITSPTYEGVLSDIEGICAAAHARNIPCIVDEAHGAHLRWSGLPDSLSQGADLVIQSLHKTMPALTQTALLHVNGPRVSRERLARMLAIYQTSSPSYVLMASMSQCLDWTEGEGNAVFQAYKEQTEAFRRRMEGLKYLRLYRPQGPYDWGKLVILTEGLDMTGKELYNELRDTYQLQMEMVSDQYVLAMSTVGDSPEGLDRLAEALLEMDWYYGLDQMGKALLDMDRPEEKGSCRPKRFGSGSLPERGLEIHEAMERPAEMTALAEAVGRMAGDYLYLYPPGIPLLVPGEVIREEDIGWIRYYTDQGLTVHGGYAKGQIKVIQKDKEQRNCG